MTEESRLEEILFKGDLARRKRDRRFRTENLLGLQLPSVDVFNFDLVLRPTKPLIPETVVTDRCQQLDDVLEVLAPRPDVDDGGGQEAAGGEEQGDGPPRGGGVRQYSN